MSMFSDKKIKQFVKEGRIKISSYKDKYVEPASYDATLHQVLKAGEGMIFDSNVREFELLPNHWAAVSSEEIMELPTDVAAVYGIPSDLARKGLIAFGGAQIDPGYKGRIFTSIYNPTLEPIMFKKGEKMFTIIFYDLDQQSRGYTGKFQNQTDFPDEYVAFMMKMKSVDVATLNENLRKLSDRVEKLEPSIIATINDKIDVIRERISINDKEAEGKAQDRYKTTISVIIGASLIAGTTFAILNSIIN